MRRLCVVLVSFFIPICMYAGDVSHFVNLGFSQDGSKFAFGQYGLADTMYRTYGEIYAIEVKSNSFLKNGIFRTSPTKETAGKDGLEVFDALKRRSNASFVRWGIDAEKKGRRLYIKNDEVLGSQSMFFKDFETSDEYTVALHVSKKTNMECSFHLVVDIVKPNGQKITKQVGRPGYVRPGVKDYSLKEIIIDETGHALIFVIEKHEYDPKGDSIRYMVESLYL